ncbi:DUF58 domain-containing protein [Rubrivirga sp.]|uniref:DUF58 domain-containing protein n=1 Tax=Rubrivirga sp. TaxID=1885344 RepID=UPI003C75A0E9
MSGARGGPVSASSRSATATNEAASSRSDASSSRTGQVGVALWNPFRDVFLTARPFWILLGLAVGFVVAFFWPPLLPVLQVAALAFAVSVVADVVLLWGSGGVLEGERVVPDKLSLGDDNPVEVEVASTYGVRIRARVIDEVPVQFQHRSDGRVLPLPPRGRDGFVYTLRPTLRGAYAFGRLLAYASTPLGLVARRFEVEGGGEAAVYPSIIQMRRFAFLAEQNRLREVGIKKVRRRGRTMEFDQIRDYVPGDDRRAVNWKATARRSVHQTRLMVNTYQDEREQPVVVALDMGRAMRSPFESLTLLDHAINASLVVLNTALQTQDRAGLVAFDREVQTVIRPDRKRGQLGTLLDALYRLDPGYQDPSFEDLYAAVRSRLRQRGLMLLMTNFDTVAGLERQLPYLRQIARAHRLVVVLFENTGIRDLLTSRSDRLEDVYVRSTARALAQEKREIARTLERHGIGVVLTTPEHLTPDAVNRYLELKSQGTF